MSVVLLTSRPTESESTLVLTLSNPGARNALHPDMYAAGIEALDSVERDPSIRAVERNRPPRPPRRDRAKDAP